MSATLPDWAQQVGALRKKLGLKQVEFAERFGVTQPAVFSLGDSRDRTVIGALYSNGEHGPGTGLLLVLGEGWC